MGEWERSLTGGDSIPNKNPCTKLENLKMYSYFLFHPCKTEKEYYQ